MPKRTKPLLRDQFRVQSTFPNLFVEALVKKGMFLPLLLCGSFLAAGDEIPPNLMAKIVVSLSRMAGHPKCVASSDAMLNVELKKLGVKLDKTSPVVVASSEDEVKRLHAEKKLVICENLMWLPKGAAIAVVGEEDKPTIYLHLRHIDETGIKFSKELFSLSYVINKPEKK